MATTIDDVEVLGVFLQSLARACVNLRLIAGREAAEACAIDADVWYPARRFQQLFEHVVGRFPDSRPIRERIGMEMMKLWYDPGPGRTIISCAVDFLRYQTGSEGYHSLVRGPDDAKGAFTLVEHSRDRALIYSTTPFDRTMERGVLVGGLSLTGDAALVRVDNSPNPSRFHVELH